MSKRFYACVYGGANDRIASTHIKAIENLGKILVDNGYALVYGAGGSGCMGAIARGVKENGGYVMGVAPDFIGDFEAIFPCDNNVLVDTMSERKTIMEKHADIYFIAPGGIGTMDEFFQVLTLKYLRRIDTPIVVLNLDGFYDTLIALIKDLIKQGAVLEMVEGLFDVVTDVNDEKVIELLMAVKN